MGKTRACNAIFANLKEEHDNVDTLIKSEGEATSMATHEYEVDPYGTISSKTYLKNYSRVRLNKTTEAFGKSAKQKEIRSQKNSKKNCEATGTPQFDVIAQLANILTCITLYELFRLSKVTRDTLT